MIIQVKLSNCFKLHYTSMISKYSKIYPTRTVFIVLFTVYTLGLRKGQ